MKPYRKLWYVLWANLLVTVLFIPASFGKQSITIYTSVPTKIMTKIEKAFEAGYGDIDLNVFRSGTGKIAAKIAAEREAGGVKADIIWLADFAYYDTLKGKGLLMPYKTKAAKGIPEALVDKDGYYYGARMICMVLAYNTGAVKNPPKNWKALQDAKWSGSIVMPNPHYSGAALDTFGALTMNYGLSYFQKLRKNKAVVVRGNSGAARKIAGNEFSVGLTLDYIVRNLKAKGSPIDLVYPEDGTVAIPSPIAIIKGTKNSAAAKKFLDFAVSDKGQETLRQLGNFIPVRPNLASPANTPSLSDLMSTAMAIDWEYIRQNTKWLKNQFSTIMLD